MFDTFHEIWGVFEWKSKATTVYKFVVRLATFGSRISPGTSGRIFRNLRPDFPKHRDFQAQIGQKFGDFGKSVPKFWKKILKFLYLTGSGFIICGKIQGTLHFRPMMAPICCSYSTSQQTEVFTEAVDVYSRRVFASRFTSCIYRR